jgi:hypothetical protein
MSFICGWIVGSPAPHSGLVNYERINSIVNLKGLEANILLFGPFSCVRRSIRRNSYMALELQESTPCSVFSVEFLGVLLV